MDRFERVAHFERALGEVCAAAQALDGALERFAAAQDAARELDGYYSGGLWRKDYEADGRGKLPPVSELPRGVLSEDAAYDALYVNRRLLERMRELAEQYLSE